MPKPHLSPPRQSGRNQMPQFIMWNLLTELFDKLRPLGPGADQRHVAAQDVDQLWQLIEPSASKKCPHTCYAGIPMTCPHRAVSLGVLSHRPEFENPKWSPISAHADLPV